MLSWGACHIQHDHEIEPAKNLVPALKQIIQPSAPTLKGCHQP
jgi:hypothetical protein